MKRFEDTLRRGGGAALLEAEKFFMKTGAVHETLRRIAAKLDELGIAYAVSGGMAVSAHGHSRTTDAVDIIVTSQGLAAIHAELEGRGYVPPFKGSRNLRDTQTAVRVEFLVSGQYPGDGKPKPVQFPDPASAAVEIEGIKYLGLPVLLELKLASGMTGAGRYKDLADVLDLIRVLKLPRDFGQRLSPYVREKFDEIWREAERVDQEPPQ